MYKILAKRDLAPNVHEYVIDCPHIATNAHAGQFIILRVTEDGERLPFTICDFDREKGTICILVQSVGYSTTLLATYSAGDSISDIVGPLGMPTNLDNYHNIVLVGGGIGTAVIFPQAKHLCSIANPSTVIVGARNRELIMYEDEFRKVSKKLLLATDDGSYGVKGFVTDILKNLLETETVDCVFAVGPMPMMRAVCNLTKEYKVHTVVSMNSTMVDGTGMCGCCRVTVGGETKYACVHGPEFDGHLIDWDEAINRSKAYREIEQEHKCKIR